MGEHNGVRVLRNEGTEEKINEALKGPKLIETIFRLVDGREIRTNFKIFPLQKNGNFVLVEIMNERTATDRQRVLMLDFTSDPENNIAKKGDVGYAIGMNPC